MNPERPNPEARDDERLGAKPDPETETAPPAQALAALPERPRMRPVDMLPVDHEGQRLFLLRDPLGYADQTLALSGPAAFLVSLCDGSRRLLDIQTEFARLTGEILFSETLTDLLGRLDEASFLDSPRFAARLQEVHASFEAASLRAAAHAGASYPDDPGELRALVGRWLDEGARPAVSGAESLEGPPGEDRRPDPPPEVPGTGRGYPSHRRSGERGAGPHPARALIAPHIDLRVGGPASGRAWAALEANPEIEVVFILGTAHASPEAPFVLTRKSYETPLGTVPTDIEIVDEIARRLPFDPFDEEIVHRREHSIEFQAVFLAALAERRDAGGRPIRAVPILCGSVHEAVEARGRPEESAGFAASIAVLKETIASLGPAAAVVAGADLSHVGLRFGDEATLDAAFLGRVQALDRASLAAAARGDASGFYDAIAEGRDRFRCCGITPIYALLRVAGVSSGTLLAYEQMKDETGVVSYASMALA